MTRRTVEVDLTARVGGFTSSTERASQSVDRLHDKATKFARGHYDATASVDTKAGSRALSDLDRKLARFAARSATARVNLDSAQAQQRLSDVQSQLTRLGSRVSEARVTVDDAAAHGTLSRIESSLLRVGSTTADPDIDLEGVAAAEAELAGLSAKLERLDGNTYSANVRVTGTVSAAGRVQALAASLATLGPAAVAAGVTAAGGLAALGATLPSLATGAATAGLAFSGLGDALDAMGKVQASAAGNAAELASANQAAARQVADASRAVRRAEGAQARAAGQGAADITAAKAAVAQARADAAWAATRAAEQVAAAEAAQARAAEQGREDIAAAKAALARAYDDAAWAAAQAARRVEAAEADLADAHDQVRYALEDLHAARQQAIRDMAEMRERSRDLALSQEAAEIGLIEARKRLAEVTASGTATELDLRKARLGVAEAEDRLSDVNREASRNREELSDAEQAGVSGSQQVVDARRQVQQAEQGVTDARAALERAIRQQTRTEQESARSIQSAVQGVADARESAAERNRAAAERVADAQRQLARTELESSRSIQAAVQGVADARERAAQRNQAAARQVADAQRQLQRAMADSASGMSATSTEAQNLAAAMGKLSPAGRDFVRFLDSLRPKLDMLQATAQAGLLPGVQEGLRDLTTIMPEVNRLVGAVATAMGELAAEAGDALTDPFWRNYITFLATEAGPTIQSFGRIVGNIAKGFAGMQMALSPLTDEIIGDLQDMSAAFADWGATLGANPQFQDFVAFVRLNGPQLLSLLSSAADAVYSLGQAFAPLGPPVMSGLELFADIVAAIASSDAGPVLASVAASVGALTLAVKGFDAVKSSTVGGWLRGTRRASTSATTRLGKLAGFLRGPWGAALAVAGGAVALFANTLREDQIAIESWRAALEQANGESVEFTRKTIAQKLEAEGLLGPLTDLGMAQQAIAAIMQGESSPAMAKLTGKIRGQNTVMTQGRLVAGGVKKSQEALTETGRKLLDGVTAASTAWSRNQEELGRVEGATATVSQTQITAKLRANGYKTTVKDLSEELHRNEVELRDVWAAQYALNTLRREGRVAEREYHAAVDAATKALARNGGTVDLNTEAGRRNDAMLMALIQTGEQRIGSLIKQGASTEEVRRVSEKHRQKLNQLMEQFGFSEKASRLYTDELLRTPREIATTVDANTKPGRSAVENFIEALEDELDGIDDVEVNVAFREARARRNVGMSPYATGGEVAGPGNGTSDSIPIWASNGEWVIQEKVSSSQGAGRMAALNAGRADIVPRYAAGGAVGDPRQPRWGPQRDSARLVGAPMHGDASIALDTEGMPAVADALGDALREYVNSMFMAGAGGDWSGAIRQALAIEGVLSPANVARTAEQIQIESGGDPDIVNTWDSNWRRGTPSVGLLQVIGPTYAGAMASHPRADVGPYRYGTSVNPVANILAGTHYARGRYGSLASIWPTAGGYAQGGPVGTHDQGGWLGHNQAAVNTSGSAEFVLSPRMIDQFTDLVDALGDVDFSAAARAASEMLTAVRSGRTFYEDFSYRGMSDQAARYQDEIAAWFYQLNPGFDFGGPGSGRRVEDYLADASRVSGLIEQVEDVFSGIGDELRDWFDDLSERNPPTAPPPPVVVPVPPVYLGQVGGLSGSTNREITVNVYNPVAETASDSTQRRLGRMSELGMFS